MKQHWFSYALGERATLYYVWKPFHVLLVGSFAKACSGYGLCIDAAKKQLLRDCSEKCTSRYNWGQSGKCEESKYV